MRLWHESLIPFLPRQQLLGLHREVCALRGNGWGKPHSVVNYVFDHPYEWLFVYHKKVMDEMRRRGYNVSPEWYRITYRGKTLGFDSGFNRVCLQTAAAKNGKTCIYPEHNAEYLHECLDNLAGKGIHINMEVQNASDL